MTARTPLEQRLAGALAARAEQVGPDGLAPAGLPAPQRRRPVVPLLVAAAAVAVLVVGVGVVADDAPERVAPAPAPAPVDPVPGEGVAVPTPAEVDATALRPGSTAEIVAGAEPVGLAVAADGGELTFTVDGVAYGFTLPRSRPARQVLLPAMRTALGSLAVLAASPPDADGRTSYSVHGRVVGRDGEPVWTDLPSDDPGTPLPLASGPWTDADGVARRLHTWVGEDGAAYTAAVPARRGRSADGPVPAVRWTVADEFGGLGLVRSAMVGTPLVDHCLSEGVLAPCGGR